MFSLVFEDLKHQTAKASELYKYIHLTNSELNKKEVLATEIRSCHSGSYNLLEL
jgi:hypothetical protein